MSSFITAELKCGSNRIKRKRNNYAVTYVHYLVFIGLRTVNYLESTNHITEFIPILLAVACNVAWVCIA